MNEHVLSSTTLKILDISRRNEMSNANDLQDNCIMIHIFDVRNKYNNCITMKFFTGGQFPICYKKSINLLEIPA